MLCPTRNKSLESFKILARHGMGKDVTEKLKKYIKEDRPSRFKSFVHKRGIDVSDITLTKGQNLLHYCCKYGEELIFRYLLKTDINFTLQDDNGDTPLHLALRRANKTSSDTNTVYTSIILPLLEKCPELLEVSNDDGISCRSLLDRLVQKRQTQHTETQSNFHESEDCNDPGSWEDKLADEMRDEHEDFLGRYQNDHFDDEYSECYDDWADRMRSEYHMKHKYGGRCHDNKMETTSAPHSKEKTNRDKKLENERKKMREKYEENQKRDRENRVLLKSKNYLKNIADFHSGDSEIKYDDVPWPFIKDIVEIRNVMFHEVLTNNDVYKKRLRQEQIRWHPDKFLQKYGKHLYESHKDKIIERVKEISQELNRLSDLV